MLLLRGKLQTSLPTKRIGPSRPPQKNHFDIDMTFDKDKISHIKIEDWKLSVSIKQNYNIID